jgi:hypothetical protein
MIEVTGSTGFDEGTNEPKRPFGLSDDLGGEGPETTRSRSFAWNARLPRSWKSTYTACQGFLLIGFGVFFVVIQQWLLAALMVAVGAFAVLYARRRYPEWQARWDAVGRRH